MKNFGKRLTKLRKEKNTTIEELAKFLKIDKTALILWEKNKMTLSIGNIIKVSQYFKISVDYLLGL